MPDISLEKVMSFSSYVTDLTMNSNFAESSLYLIDEFPCVDNPVRKPADKADARGMLISSTTHQKTNFMLVSSCSSNRKISSLKA